MISKGNFSVSKVPSANHLREKDTRKVEMIFARHRLAADMRSKNVA